MPVVLVGVVREIAKNKIRFYHFNNIFNFTDKILVHDQMGVGISTPVGFGGGASVYAQPAASQPSASTGSTPRVSRLAASTESRMVPPVFENRFGSTQGRLDRSSLPHPGAFGLRYSRSRCSSTWSPVRVPTGTTSLHACRARTSATPPRGLR